MFCYLFILLIIIKKFLFSLSPMNIKNEQKICKKTNPNKIEVNFYFLNKVSICIKKSNLLLIQARNPKTLYERKMKFEIKMKILSKKKQNYENTRQMRFSPFA